MKTVSAVAYITGCVSFIAQTKRSLALAVLLSWSAVLNASDLSHSHILVATPELRDNIYGSTILIVKALGGDQHVGVIVNRPAGVSLAKLFPEHGPSQNLTDSVYFGGPVGADMIYALVRRSDNPPGKSVELLPGLYLVVDSQGVDRVIESEADHARFVAGLVVWRAGELAEEVKAGAWYILEAHADVAMRKPEGLWEELVQRSRTARGAI
jgi:putative transcriptional regulator